MATDLLIDKTTEDISLNSGGDLDLVSDLSELAQSVQTELGTIRGTHVDDDTYGVPFLEVIFKRNPDLGLIVAVIRSTLEERADINSITEFLPTVDFSTRKHVLTFKADTTQGLLDSAVEI